MITRIISAVNLVAVVILKVFLKLKIETVASESGTATGAKRKKLFQNNECGILSVLNLTNQIFFGGVTEISSQKVLG
jgi:hypothetical protein